MAKRFPVARVCLNAAALEADLGARGRSAASLGCAVREEAARILGIPADNLRVIDAVCAVAHGSGGNASGSSSFVDMVLQGAFAGREALAVAQLSAFVEVGGTPRLRPHLLRRANVKLRFPDADDRRLAHPVGCCCCNCCLDLGIGEGEDCVGTHGGWAAASQPRSPHVLFPQLPRVPLPPMPPPALGHQRDQDHLRQQRRAAAKVNRARARDTQAALCVQSWWRRLQPRLDAWRMRQAVRAAILIQAWWRGESTRVRTSARLTGLYRFLDLVRLSMLARRWVRGYRCRRGAALVIQQFWRPWARRQARLRDLGYAELQAVVEAEQTRLWKERRSRLWAASGSKRRQSRTSASGYIAEPRAMTGFSVATLSSNLISLHGGRTVVHSHNNGKDDYGVALGDGPLPSFEAGRFFELEVTHLYADAAGLARKEGLVVGVTTTSPAAYARRAPARYADDVPESWTAGYDGAYIERGAGEDAEGVATDTDWFSSELEVGDVVGVLVSAASFSVFHNDVQVLRRSGHFPADDVRLYAVVSLLGRTQGVTFVRESAPPTAR